MATVVQPIQPARPTWPQELNALASLFSVYNAFQSRAERERSGSYRRGRRGDVSPGTALTESYGEQMQPQMAQDAVRIAQLAAGFTPQAEKQRKRAAQRQYSPRGLTRKQREGVEMEQLSEQIPVEKRGEVISGMPKWKKRQYEKSLKRIDRQQKYKGMRQAEKAAGNMVERERQESTRFPKEWRDWRDIEGKDGVEKSTTMSMKVEDMLANAVSPQERIRILSKAMTTQRLIDQGQGTRLSGGYGQRIRDEVAMYKAMRRGYGGGRGKEKKYAFRIYWKGGPQSGKLVYTSDPEQYEKGTPYKGKRIILKRREGTTAAPELFLDDSDEPAVEDHWMGPKIPGQGNEIDNLINKHTK